MYKYDSLQLLSDTSTLRCLAVSPCRQYESQSPHHHRLWNMLFPRCHKTPPDTIQHAHAWFASSPRLTPSAYKAPTRPHL